MLNTLLFDLDDTILDFHSAERLAVARALSDFNICVNDKILERYSEINLNEWKRLERGEITRDEVKVGRYRLLFDEYKIDASPALTTAKYEKYLSEGHIFIDGAEKLLNALYYKYDLYLVSNGSLSVQRGRIASANIAGFFKGIFISEEIGADKPSKMFFDKCFSMAGINKNNTAIVGDSLTSDILGGKNAGITTVWYNPKGLHYGEIKPDYVIHNLCDLLSLLNTINETDITN